MAACYIPPWWLHLAFCLGYAFFFVAAGVLLGYVIWGPPDRDNGDAG